MVKILNCYLYAKKSYGTSSKSAIFFGQPCIIPKLQQSERRGIFVFLFYSIYQFPKRLIVNYLTHRFSIEGSRTPWGCDAAFQEVRRSFQFLFCKFYSVLSFLIHLFSIVPALSYCMQYKDWANALKYLVGAVHYKGWEPLI